MTTQERRHGTTPEAVPVASAGTSAYDLFAASAERFADRLAVADDQRRWTYAELAARVAAITAALAAEDPAPGARVGLMLNRGADFVAAVLAVWRCGLTYVPLDPTIPRARADALLRSSSARLVLSDGAPHAEQLDAAGRIDLRLGLGPAPPRDDPAAEAERRRARAANEVAYVIFTSGTTGRPKGVVIRHSSVVNLARAHRERIYRHHALSVRGLRATLGASFAFDGAVERILLLLYGHSLFVIGDVERVDPERYISFVSANRLEALDLTPAFLRLLLQYGLLTRPGWAPELVLVGGEAIPPLLWRELATSGTSFYNVYGPTETTVNASIAPVAGEAPHLGHPLANTRIDVLGESGEALGPGEEGEIHVSGAGLAAGYDGLPELTGAKFKQNPFAGSDPLYQRMYATGDRGRFRADGALEFLGRTDEQIKLRGFRIEPEEITTLLCDAPEVEDALMRVRESGDGERQRLVAYVAGADADADDLPERLRSRLREQLPGYMVPSAIIPVERFPLTATGKVDDAALAELGEVEEAGAESPAIPDGVDPGLYAIWREILEVGPIEPNASFFELGGHSLSAIAMIGRVNEELGVELPIATLFTAPTIVSFDRALQDARRGSAA